MDISSSADLIIINGKLLIFDQDSPKAEAFAIFGIQTIVVGSKKRNKRYFWACYMRFDAQEKTVLPGSCEAHLHLFTVAFGVNLLHLGGVHGPDQIRKN